MVRACSSAIALATALALLAGCEPKAHATGSVPWLNRPVGRYAIPQPKLIPCSTSAPPCRASQLRVSQGRGGAAGGTAYERLVFTNTGQHACLLRGHPAITGVGQDGVRVRLRLHRVGLTFFELAPADVAPGGHSLLDLATADACDGGLRKPTIYRELHIIIASDETVHAAPATRVFVVCGLFESGFGLPARYTPLAPSPGTPATLHADVRIAKSVRAGSVLTYTIILTNPTSTAITLKPCPSYNEGIYAAGHVLRRWLALNCTAVHTIPAHAHVRYAMELAIPATTPAGIAKFGWSLNTANGPAVGRVITVTTPQ